MSGGFRSRSAGRRQEASARAAKPSVRTRRTRPAVEEVKIGDRAREVAFLALLRVECDQAFANLVLPKLLREHRVRGKDAAFATELSYGALRTQGVIDAVIGACSSRKLDDIAPEALAALRLGVYQLLYTRVAPHAAVDTSVALVEAAGLHRVKGFVNGILRSVARKKPEQWIEELSPNDPLGKIAFRHAHPAWIARSFAAALGASTDDLDEVEAALRADSERPEVHLAARPGEMSAEELALVAGGEEGRYSPYAVYLPQGNPGDVDAVKQGFARVQDEGSQLIARAFVEVVVQDDQGKWLDLCSGPGGKTALIGALAQIDGAHVDAVEVAAHRAELVRKATDGLPVAVHVDDGRDPKLTGGYDRVLVDVPCSGLGSLRRRPEARWTKQEDSIAELNELQEALLASAITLTRPGGIIVYSTCSPDLRETRQIIDAAVLQQHVAELDAAPLVLPMNETGKYKSVQMWPHLHGTDAMFFAVLRKLPEEDS